MEKSMAIGNHGRRGQVRTVSWPERVYPLEPAADARRRQKLPEVVDRDGHGAGPSGHLLAMSTPEVVASGQSWAWRKDVALEVWVDGGGPSIGLRLSGTLDQDTATNLAQLVEELIGDGGRDFYLEIHALRVTGAGGQVALAEVRRLIQTAGGRLFWDGSTIARHIAVSDDASGHLVTDDAGGG
jgi:ABC-type transporter Mla MlaB component